MFVCVCARVRYVQERPLIEEKTVQSPYTYKDCSIGRRRILERSERERERERDANAYADGDHHHHHHIQKRDTSGAFINFVCSCDVCVCV